MNLLKAIFSLIRETIAEFIKDRAAIYAAGLAYYGVFSIAPLLVFATAVAGRFIGEVAAGEQVTLQLQYLFGPELAGFLENVVDSLTDRTANATAAIISIGVLLFTAGGIFNQLKTALNLLWGLTDVRPRNAREWRVLVRYRAIPFLMVFVLGLFLSLSVILETLILAVSARFEVLYPEIADLLPSFGRVIIPILVFVTVLLIFKFLPNAYSRVRDIAVGAALTTVLFVIGRLLLLFFLSISDTGSLYGAAGSIVILLVWIYVSAQILLFGAEFTWVYARRYGKPIRPNRLARFLIAPDPAAPAPPPPDSRPPAVEPPPAEADRPIIDK
jgi:membrane protein